MVDNPATEESVRNAIERPLTPDENRVLPTWLGTAWRKLRDVPSLQVEARMQLPALMPDGRTRNPMHLSADAVRDAVVAIVERKLRNPDMLRTWSGDTAGFTIDSEASAGKLYVSQNELNDLAVPGQGSPVSGMYSIPLGGT